MFAKEVIAVAEQIGQFYLEKNSRDYKATADEIKKLTITDLEVSGDCVKIHLARPGLLIGKKGENIGALEKALGKKIEIFESKSVVDLIVPVDWNRYEEEIKDHFSSLPEIPRKSC